MTERDSIILSARNLTEGCLYTPHSDWCVRIRDLTFVTIKRGDPLFFLQRKKIDKIVNNHSLSTTLYLQNSLLHVYEYKWLSSFGIIYYCLAGDDDKTWIQKFKSLSC